MKLNQLVNNPGAKRERKRVGRGPASGTGKTCGKGHKGQKARKGVAINGFEGGQNSLLRRLPKRGFNNIFRKSQSVINTGQLQAYVDSKKIDASKPVTRDVLIALGLAKSEDIIKLLAKGDVTSSLKLEVDKASASAIKAIEKAKGSVQVKTSPAEATA